MRYSFPVLGVASSATLAGTVLASVIVTTTVNAQEIPAELKARMTKEKEDRRTCKISICKAFASPITDALPIQCEVTKTWLAADIQKSFLGDRLSWPWGHAQCKAGIQLDSAQIAAAMQPAGATLKLKKHDITCTLDSKEANKEAAYTVKLSIQPEVIFKDGKATQVTMGWSNIEAPTLAKGAIWSATKLDQAFSVMSSGIRKEINDFLYNKCPADGVTVSGG
jgi:hypothetical protein